MMHHYRNAEITRIVCMRMAKIHPLEIAEVTRRTKKAIDRILSLEKARRGIIYPTLPHKDTKWNNAKIEDIAQQTRNRKQCDIALELNVSASMISQLMCKRAMMIREANL